MLRRSECLKKPKLVQDSTYGKKSATDVLQQTDKKFFENIFDDNPFEEHESQHASGSNIEQTAKDNGNKAVKMLLSKAVAVKKELPGSTKDVGDWTYKDVDKLKMTDPESHKLWHEAMKGEVKALDD